MKDGRTPGENKITKELLEIGGRVPLAAVEIVINKCVQHNVIPETFQNVRNFQKKSSTYKILKKIITNRLRNELDDYHPVEETDFRKGYSTREDLQTIRIIVKNVMNTMYQFVDYHKAFDSRYRDLLKQIYNKTTIPINIDEN